MAWMPDILKPPGGAEADRIDSKGFDRARIARWAIGLIVAMTVAQLAFLAIGCDWDLWGDEAEYWTWSRHLDWNYHCKGPLIALVIRLGTELLGDLSIALTGSWMLAVRVPAVLVGAFTAWGIFQLANETLGRSRAGLIAVLLLPAVPIFRLGGLLMTPDTPLELCWVWGGVWAYRGVVRDRAVPWAAAGLFAALGVLTKATMLAFPVSVGAFLVLSSGHRRQLARPGFWLMALICGLGFVPILVWDIQSGWVFAGQLSDRVGLVSTSHWGRVRPVFDFLGGEVVVWGLYWPLGALALVQAARTVLNPRLEWEREEIAAGETPAGHPGSRRDGLLYLLWLWAVVWLACMLAAVAGEREANWAAPAYLAVLVLIGFLVEGMIARGLRPAVAVGLLGPWWVSVVGLTAMQHSEWFYPALARFAGAPSPGCPVPMERLDPTCRMRGPRELGAEVARQLDALRASGQKPFVLAPMGMSAATLSFYLPGRPETYCLDWSPGMAARVVNQHDLWRPNPRHDPAAFLGRPAVVVEKAGGPTPSYVRGLLRRGIFGAIESTSRFEVRRGEIVVGAWDVSVCRDYRGLQGVETMRAYLATYSNPTYYAAQGGTPSGYIRGLYRDILGRAPSRSDLTFWSGVLASQSSDLVVASIVESKEGVLAPEPPISGSSGPAGPVPISASPRSDLASRKTLR